MEYAVSLFAALSGPLRLRSLALMAAEGELCVCELTHALRASQPTISKHLAALREAGLVTDRREAQWVFYSLAAGLPSWVGRALAAALEGVSGAPEHGEDVRRLKEMPSRPARRRHAAG